MHPRLIEIPFLHLTLWSFGAMAALGGLAAFLLVRRMARRAGIDPLRMVDGAMYSLILGMVGARAFFVLHHYDEFRGDPLGVLAIWRGGLEFLGGVVPAILFLLLYVRRHRLPLRRYLDIMAVGLMLGLAFGRIGCFLNGCCYGKPCDLAWAVTFPAGSIASYEFPGIALHPTQIYESLAGIAICVILLAVEKRKPFDGFLLWLMLLLLAVSRFAVDLLRTYERTSMVGGALTTNQVIGLALIAAAATAIAVGAARSRRAR